MGMGLALRSSKMVCNRRDCKSKRGKNLQIHGFEWINVYLFDDFPLIDIFLILQNTTGERFTS